jgi:hypothetical protein
MRYFFISRSTTGSIAATTPSETGAFFDPMNERAYVHPHFYKAPRGVRGV